MLYRFFTCKAYDESIFKLCEKNNAHYHAGSIQKELFMNITPPTIIMLQYQKVLLAYGEVEKAFEGENHEKGFEDWTNIIKLKGKWIWKDENDHRQGVSINGVKKHRLSGGGRKDTITEIDSQYGLKKMKDINSNTDLIRMIEKEIAKAQDMEKINEYVTLLKNNHNLILTGAPGTGKTYLAKRIIAEMICNKDYNEAENNTIFEERCSFVQFHPSYDYTDFVEGLRPIIDEKGNVGFERKDGIFKEFCKKALKSPNKEFAFIIDEINRGDISKIIGELFFSIDQGYRGKKGMVKTQFQNLIKEDDDFYNGFYVPENVYIIGTMNDIDRSVESMDFAMRRRFAWKEITAESQKNMLDVLANHAKVKYTMKDTDIEEVKNRLTCLNNAIEKIEGLSSAYHIGPTYFLALGNYNGSISERFNQLWDNHLKGVLNEYLRGNDNETINEAMAAFKDTCIHVIQEDKKQTEVSA